MNREANKLICFEKIKEEQAEHSQFSSQILYSKPVPRVIENFSGNLTVFTCLFFCLLFLVVIKIRQAAEFRFIIASFYKGKGVIQPFKGEQIFVSAASLFLLVNFVLMSSILTHYTILTLNFPGNVFCRGLKSFEIIIFVLGCYGVKLTLTRIIQFVIGMNDGLTEYRHNILLFCQNVGMLLLPIIILITYVDVKYKLGLIYIALSMFVLLYFYRLLKTIGISVRESVPWLYLFLYLCAFEISPIIIAIKLLFGADS